MRRRSCGKSNTAIGKVKTQTPLAAIAIGPGPNAIRFNLYAISDSGTLIAWFSINENFKSTNTTFTPGPFSDKGVVPGKFLNLAAVCDRICYQF
ncbi:hypothetical protein N7G274_004806 [Stereocaulon virgatum]|uniref:Uncharacterized protein n=1 Tax=Stereocaulon virgatum TaxID=373712 RepID=A0ABR4ACT6_9LECA